MERWMISCDFTILQAPPSDGNVSVHATKAAKSVVGVSEVLGCPWIFATLTPTWFNLFNASSHLSPGDGARCSL